MHRDDKRPSQERLVIETFDRLSKTYSDDRYSGSSSAAHSFIVRRQRVYELLKGCKKGRLLDVGCGPGVMTEWLVDNGFEFFGIDISKEMITRCEKKFGHIRSVHFSVGRIEGLEFPDSFFDIVICMGVVEYLEDDSATIREMSRVLKPGGNLIVTLPNRLSPFNLWYRIVCNRGLRNTIKRTLDWKIEDLPVSREYIEKRYCNLIASHKLRVTDVVYYNFKLFLFPLDRLFPGLTVLVTKRLEFLARGSLRWLGTGFIVKAEKR